jgi:FlaA1/EpsC-like NDP-sugar epimerase
MHRKSGVIGTTGANMTRFFFTVHEAADLVMTAIEGLSQFQGKVLSRKMKSALIRDVLDVWIAEKGGSWKPIEGRPGDRDQEFLVGDRELPYTRRVEIGEIPHYLISFNEREGAPLPEPVSSDNAVRLTRDELNYMINNPPEPEWL